MKIPKIHGRVSAATGAVEMYGAKPLHPAGFYWARLHGCDEWQVLEHNDGEWWATGTDNEVSGPEITELGPRLAPPAEDDDALAAFARELYEADAWHNQQVINFPIEHWEGADIPTQERWLNVARTAMAFRPKA